MRILALLAAAVVAATFWVARRDAGHPRAVSERPEGAVAPSAPLPPAADLRVGPVPVVSGDPPAGPVSVLVFDRATGEGIAGAAIAAEDGRFFAALPLSCDVFHPLYRDERAMKVDWRWPAIPLSRGASVSGTVRLADGAPAAGVPVSVGDEWAECDEAGRYVVGGLPYEGPVEVVACEEWESARVVEPGAEGVDFVLSGSVLRVRALDEAGEAISGASHRVAWGDRSEEEAGTPWTTRSVPPGVPILVRASAHGRFAAETAVNPATTRPQCFDVDLVLRGAPAAILPIVVKDGADGDFHEAFVSVVGGSGEEMRAHVSGFSCERWVVVRRGENAEVEFVVPQAVHMELHWKGKPGAELAPWDPERDEPVERLSRSPYAPTVRGTPSGCRRGCTSSARAVASRRCARRPCT